MPEVRQSSFGAGEFSASLYGADHLPAYLEGARTARNVLVSKQRTLLNRTGTVYCGEVKDSTKLARLLPFTFSNDQSYAVETGDLYARVWDAAGNQIKAQALIALGASGAHQKSTDKGATWTTPTAPGIDSYAAACEAANGRIVVVGSTGGGLPVCTTSDDGGATWTARTLPGSVGYGSVAYNGRVLLALTLNATAALAISYDNGNTWAAVSSPPALFAEGRGALAWGGGRWAVVGRTTSGTSFARWSYSYDGLVWSAAAAVGDLDTARANGHTLYAVCRVGGQFFAVGKVQTDAVPNYKLLWAKFGLLTSNWLWGETGVAGTDRAFYGVVSDGKTKAVTVGAILATGPVAYLYDSVADTVTSLAPTGAAILRGLAYSRGYWVIVGDSVCKRYDGTTWTSDPTIAAGTYYCVATCLDTETLEVVTPHAQGILRELMHAQSGDVLTLFHRTQPPKELRRYGLYDWRTEDWYKTPPTLKVTGLTIAVTPATDINHPAKEWQWVVTWEDEETGRESLGSDALTPGGGGTIAIYPDRPATIRWNVIVKAARYNVYRGRNAFFGYVGTVEQPVVAAGSSPTTVDFRDDGQIPIYSEPPPKWTNPFQSDLSYPACGCYLDDRLVVGGSTVQPATVRGSHVADYYNFDEALLPGPDSPFEFTLSTRRYEEIRWLVPLELLAIGTSETEWAMSGAAGTPLAADSVFARARSSRGAARLHPIVVGDVVVFVQNGGQVVRAISVRDSLAQLQDSSLLGGQELSLLSAHLLEGYSIVDWAYAKEPHSVIWAVRSDGALLSLTIIRDHGIAAWARHDSGGDTFEAVTCVPNGSEDVAFFIVKRTINGATKRYVERLATRYPATLSAAVFLDCSKTYVGTATNTVTGLSHLEAKTVGVLADGTYRGSYTVASGSVTFTGSAATTVVVGIPIVADFEPLDYPRGRTREKIVAQVGVEYRLNPAVTDTAAGLAIGQDAANLSGIRSYASASETGVTPASGIMSVPVDASFNPGGRCFVRHTQPYPLEIRGLTRVIQ